MDKALLSALRFVFTVLKLVWDQNTPNRPLPFSSGKKIREGSFYAQPGIAHHRVTIHYSAVATFIKIIF
jgi:hypothetical protein